MTVKFLVNGWMDCSDFDGIIGFRKRSRSEC